AGVGVDAHHPFLDVQPLLLGVALAALVAAGLVDEVDAAVHDDGRRAAAVGGTPQEVAVGVVGLEGELLGQPLGLDVAVVVRAAPARPFGGGGGGGYRGPGSRGQQQGEAAVHGSALAVPA